MPRKPDVTKTKDGRYQTKDKERERSGLFRTVNRPRTDAEEVREALQRLRRIGETLPPVDAAALVREGRDAAERGRR